MWIEKGLCGLGSMGCLVTPGVSIFFHLDNSIGSYICVDENTSSGCNMDIARVLIRVPFNFNLKESVLVAIDDTIIKLVVGKTLMVQFVHIIREFLFRSMMILLVWMD